MPRFIHPAALNPCRPRARLPWIPRHLAKVTGIALAALLLFPLTEGTQPAEAGKKSKTVTRTFSSSAQIDIPDSGTEGIAEPYPSTIKVDAFKKYKSAKIKDVNLKLRDFSHALPENVDVMLVLDNTRAIVMSDAGGGADAIDLTLTLDDDASDNLPDGDELESGTFRPTNISGADPFEAPAPSPNGNVALSTFNNEDPDGQWQLFVIDDFAGAATTGGLDNGWQLEITAKVKKDKKK